MRTRRRARARISIRISSHLGIRSSAGNYEFCPLLIFHTFRSINRQIISVPVIRMHHGLRCAMEWIYFCRIVLLWICLYFESASEKKRKSFLFLLPAANNGCFVHIVCDFFVRYVFLLKHDLWTIWRSNNDKRRKKMNRYFDGNQRTQSTDHLARTFRPFFYSRR